MREKIAKRNLLKLLEFGIIISRIQDMDELVDHILATACELTDSDGGIFHLFKNGTLKCARNQNLKLPINKIQDAENQRQLYTMVKKCVQQGSVIIMDDIHTSQHDNLEYFAGYRSMFLVPLVNQLGITSGVLQLVKKPAPGNKTKSYPKELIPMMESLASQSAVAIQNLNLSLEIKSAYFETIFRLSLAAECRDKTTANHLHRVSEYSAIIARYAGYPKPFQDLIKYASPMHDVGKIGIPDRILFKPDKLTKQEWEIMQSHTEIGAKIFNGSNFEVLQMAENVALCHHERYDGQGYPRKLKGNNIPVEGRIVAIADVFDALSSSRPYKDSFPVDIVFKELKLQAKRQFDPELVEAFFKSAQEILRIRKKYSPQ